MPEDCKVIIRKVLIRKCGRCNGSGQDPEYPKEKCLSCGGSGEVRIRK